MKTERSAGGIVIRRKGKGWQILLLQDMNKSWTFPKGLIEKDEEKEITAKREIKEEVGITCLTLICPLPTVRYMYRRNGLIDKTVSYFLFTYKGKERLKPQKEEGVHAVQWMSIRKAFHVVGYVKTNKKLLVEVRNKLKTKKLITTAYPYGDQEST